MPHPSARFPEPIPEGNEPQKGEQNGIEVDYKVHRRQPSKTPTPALYDVKLDDDEDDGDDKDAANSDGGKPAKTKGAGVVGKKIKNGFAGKGDLAKGQFRCLPIDALSV